MSESPIPIDTGGRLKSHQPPCTAPTGRKNDHVRDNDIVCWHRLQRHGLRRLTTSYTTLDLHPQDWDGSRMSGSNHAQFIEHRIAALQAMEAWLGENPVREGLLDRADLDHPERRATVAVRVIASSTCSVAMLNWSGLGNMVTDVIIAVSAFQLKDFDPKVALGAIATLSDRDKPVLQEKIVRALKKDVGEPAVFSISLTDGPDATCRIVSALTITLGRAMIRREVRRYQARALESTAIKSAESGPERALGLRYEWPRRISFFVERPCGAGFSHELVTALEDVGYSVIPDPRFEGGDDYVWYASRNPDHLRELLQFIGAAMGAVDPNSEDSHQQADTAISERIRQIGNVYCFSSDWKWFEPEYQAAHLRRSLGFGVRWRQSDDYRVGTYEFSITVLR